jgi:hypothetical protein
MNSETTAHERHWLQEVKSLQASYRGIVAQYPDADDVLQQVYRVLGDLVSLAGCTPKSVGESDVWVRTVDAAKRDKLSLSKILKGKSFYSAVYGTYSVTLNELKAILQGSAKKSTSQQAEGIPAANSPPVEAKDEGFREQRRRKRRSSSEDETTRQRGPKKTAPQVERQTQKAERNFFAPLRTEEMEAEEKAEDGQDSEEQQQRSAGSGRPPPIVLTSAVNLIQMQKTLKDCERQLRVPKHT